MSEVINKSNQIIYQDMFVYDTTLQTLTINRLEAWLVPCFRKLQEREKEFELQVEKGTKSLITRACRELMYVYLVEDPRSSLAAIDEEDRKRRAKGLSLLPDNYKEDKLVKEARAYYKNVCLSISTTGKAFITASKTYQALSESLDETQERLSFLRTQASDKMNTVLDSITGTDTKDMEITAILATEKSIKDLQDSLVKTLTQLPVMEETVEKLKNKWAMELGKQKELFGGRTKGNRED